jgi:hypothetical protein
MATQTTKTGDRVIVSELVGYVLPQHRPFGCSGWRPSKLKPGTYTGDCECGRCNGHTERYPGTVDRIIEWADNSTEAGGAGDDRHERRMMIRPPSGDRCY